MTRRGASAVAVVFAARHTSSAIAALRRQTDAIGCSGVATRVRVTIAARVARGGWHKLPRGARRAQHARVARSDPTIDATRKITLLAKAALGGGAAASSGLHRRVAARVICVAPDGLSARACDEDDEKRDCGEAEPDGRGERAVIAEDLHGGAEEHRPCHRRAPSFLP